MASLSAISKVREFITCKAVNHRSKEEEEAYTDIHENNVTSASERCEPPSQRYRLKEAKELFENIRRTWMRATSSVPSSKGGQSSERNSKRLEGVRQVSCDQGSYADH